MTNANTYDVAIIGAGHNALVCTNYLARARPKVVALKARNVVGGACVNEELIPGATWSSCAFIQGMLRPEMIIDSIMETTLGQKVGYQVAKSRTVRSLTGHLSNGGASGIGRSLVEHFHDQGSKVAFVVIAEKAGHALVDELALKGGHRPYLEICNLRNIDQLEAVISSSARSPRWSTMPAMMNAIRLKT